MAKKTSTRSTKKTDSKQSPLVRLVLYIVALFIAFIAVFVFGVDPAQIEEFLNNNTTEDTSNNTSQDVIQEPVSGDWYELYFTQPINSRDRSLHTGAPLEQGLIRLIDSAQKTIDAALFELNAPDTTAALIRALERGVKVRILADDEHNLDDPESTIEEVIAAGAEALSDERSALMHNKFFIVDGQRVWTGSTNVTRNDMYNNNNNAIIIRSAQLVSNYQNEFDEMFIDRVFTRSADTRPVPNRTIEINGTRIETYFSPEDGSLIESRLVELIGQSRESVRVMAFSFTLDSVGQALLDRMAQGVKVEGVVETTGSLQGQMRVLACGGAPFKQDGNPNILHSKVFIFDNQIVVMGSFNFSASARDNNSENMLIIHNPTIAQAYTAEWQKRYDEGRVPKAEDLKC